MRGFFGYVSVGTTIRFDSSRDTLRFLAFGDVCFKHSISLNTTCAPPPLVGSMSPCVFEKKLKRIIFLSVQKLKNILYFIL